MGHFGDSQHITTHRYNGSGIIKTSLGERPVQSLNLGYVPAGAEKSAPTLSDLHSLLRSIAILQDVKRRKHLRIPGKTNRGRGHGICTGCSKPTNEKTKGCLQCIARHSGRLRNARLREAKKNAVQ